MEVEDLGILPDTGTRVQIKYHLNYEKGAEMS
jgi:hypothetical protein